MMPKLPLNEMSMQEKIQAMEMLWDSLLHEPEEPESPAWHRSIVEERLRQVETGEAHFVSLDDVKSRSRK